MRLIDADALKKEIHRYALDIYCVNLENSKEFAGYSIVENYCEGLYEATELIDNFPTINAEPVKHGRWITHNLNNPFEIYGECSDCGFEQSLSNKLNFCPNCGADMREEI